MTPRREHRHQKPKTDQSLLSRGLTSRRERREEGGQWEGGGEEETERQEEGEEKGWRGRESSGREGYLLGCKHWAGQTPAAPAARGGLLPSLTRKELALPRLHTLHGHRADSDSEGLVPPEAGSSPAFPGPAFRTPACA